MGEIISGFQTPGWSDFNQFEFNHRNCYGSAKADMSMPKGSPIRAIFRNHKQELMDLVKENDAIVGCMAWFTDMEILNLMLQEKKEVLIIINKEDFKRPDRSGNVKEQVAAYRKIKAIPVSEFAWLSWQTENTELTQAFRCVGEIADKRICAKMHNKFLLFGNRLDMKFKPDPNKENWENREDEEKQSEKLQSMFGGLGERPIKTTALWTGSYNITWNAAKSFENAILMQRCKETEEVFNAYEKEFFQIVTLSESLDYEHKYMAPEFGEGTGEPDWEHVPAVDG